MCEPSSFCSSIDAAVLEVHLVALAIRVKMCENKMNTALNDHLLFFHFIFLKMEGVFLLWHVIQAQLGN